MNCKQCLKELTRYDQKIFCSKSCSATFNNKGVIRNISKKSIQLCKCGCKQKLGRGARNFATSLCRSTFIYNKHIEDWKTGKVTALDSNGTVSKWLKRYLYEKYGETCSKCGWHEINPTTNRVPIQVNHIDGNFRNNSEENLELLCPNCHSLTDTYGSLNRGNGRRLGGFRERKEIIHE